MLIVRGKMSEPLTSFKPDVASSGERRPLLVTAMVIVANLSPPAFCSCIVHVLPIDDLGLETGYHFDAAPRWFTTVWLYDLQCCCIRTRTTRKGHPKKY